MHPGWQTHHLHQLLHPGFLLVHNPLKWIVISLRTYRINSLFLNSIWFLFIVPVSFSLHNLLESTIKTKSSNLSKLRNCLLLRLGKVNKVVKKISSLSSWSPWGWAARWRRRRGRGREAWWIRARGSGCCCRWSCHFHKFYLWKLIFEKLEKQFFPQMFSFLTRWTPPCRVVSN